MRAQIVGGAEICSRLRTAHTHWTRMKGLLGTPSLPEGEGLWIRPCKQVHMYLMKYAIDVVFLDEELRVVEAIEALPVNTVSPKVNEAHSVLELPVGTIAKCGLRPGDRVAIDHAEEAVRDPLQTLGAWVSNLAMAAFFGSFLLRHLRAVQGDPAQWLTAAPILIQEGILVFLFLVRRPSRETSTRPLDWILGVGGTAIPLFLRPNATMSDLGWLGAPLQIIGLTIALLGTLSLGRSIGVVASHRGVKTGSLHGVVRHPMYAGYMVGYVGYALVHPSAYNVILVASSIVALQGRAIVEERLLRKDPAYDEYVSRVRWRFLPYVY